MGYTIFAFDGLELSQLEARADMGTGQALSSLIQIPGGGFFDNYGSNPSPQGIRPVTFSGIILDTDDDDRVGALDDLRAKIGVRGKLSILMDDDSLRWQWARLLDVSTPIDENSFSHFPFSLTWVTASQWWNGTIFTSSEWTVNDGSWTFGDGTAETGEEGVTQTLTATGATGTSPPSGGTTQSITLTNDGNKAATNFYITVSAGTTAIDAILITNSTTGDYFYYSATVGSGSILIVHCGAMNVTVDGNNAYANLTPYNKRRWLTIAPGNNTITITVNGNTSQNATIAIEYYDTWA